MNMRESVVLNKLRAGKTVNCIKVGLSDSRGVEIAGMCGVDCVWVDMEHATPDWDHVEKMILAGKTQNTDIMVRTPRGSYSDLIKPLELDASGIMVPHIMSAADAKNIVRQTKFHPIGRRPIDAGNNDGAYCLIDFHEYIKQASENRFISIQIEDPEPVAELEEICSLPGIDMIFFGPADFSHGLGKPGIWDDPELLRVKELIPRIARKHGKFAGTVGGANSDVVKGLLDMGYQFINMGADVIGLGEYYKRIVKVFNETVNQ